MAYRKTRRKRRGVGSGRSILVFVMLTCLLIGMVAGFLTRSEYMPSFSSWLRGSPSDIIPEETLSSFSRDELEGEVRRLNREITERDKNIDELRIELKLGSEGSSGRRR